MPLAQAMYLHHDNYAGVLMPIRWLLHSLVCPALRKCLNGTSICRRRPALSQTHARMM
jgi:hypothetical protein